MSQASYLFQLNYAPSVDAMALMSVSPRAVIEAHDHYQKQSFRNRCLLLSSQGVLPLVIPVQHEQGNPIPYQQARFETSRPWAIQHWRSLVSSYNKSAYFHYYSPHFEAIYQQAGTDLYAFNWRILEMFCKLFKLPLPVESSAWENRPEQHVDVREIFHPKKGNSFPPAPYYQTFEMKEGFIPGLSAYDVLFNLGPDASGYLKKRGEQLLPLI